MRWNPFWRKKVIPVKPQERPKPASDGPHKNPFVRYEINVAKNGSHIFATDKDLRPYNQEKIESLIRLFREKFPESDGYRVSVTAYGYSCPALPQSMQEALGDTVAN